MGIGAAASRVVKHQRDSPKVNVFCAVSPKKVYGPYFFEENTITGTKYLQMLQNWLLAELQGDANDFVFQQDGAPPHGIGKSGGS